MAMTAQRQAEELKRQLAALCACPPRTWSDYSLSPALGGIHPKVDQTRLMSQK